MAIIRSDIINPPVAFTVPEDTIHSEVVTPDINTKVPKRGINTELYPPGLVPKDYNLLSNKPVINGIELKGSKTLADLGIAQAPLVGPDTEITPDDAIAALGVGRAVIITKTIPFMGQSVPITFVVTMIAGNAVGGTQIFSLNNDLTSMWAIQLMGFSGQTSWGTYSTTIAREDAIPSTDLQASWSAKQDALIAGDNIDITDDEISVTGTVPKAEFASGLPYGECDSTSTSTAFTATVPGITELKSGIHLLLKNGVVTSASGFTININGLGAKPVYSNMAAATAETTKFNVNYTMLFIYDEDRVAGGCWVLYSGYDSNTNTIGYQLRTNSTTLPMDSIVYRYRLLFRSVDGNKFVPANNSTSTNATAKRTTIQTPIDPFGGIFYYGTTASVAAGSRPGATYLWTQYSINLGYSFNRTGAALTLTSYKPVYIKALPQAGGGAIIDAETPYVQALPTTNDGYIYIYLGIASSATAVEIVPEHPVYYHDGTKIKLYGG